MLPVTQVHGGLAVARALKALGVGQIFTLSGGHIFPILDGCKQAGIRIIDVRHEQTAGFAAEGWARLTRSLGVAVVTAGPGVTNVMSPVAQAGFNGAPVLVLAGRAPSFRWGQGSLQEIDHVPFVAPVAAARTVTSTDAVYHSVIEAAKTALSPPRRPAFLDFPLDVIFDSADVPDDGTATWTATSGYENHIVEAIAALIGEAQRPVIVAGSNVWLDRAEGHLRVLAEKARIPVYMNGQGRGCLPADHDLAFARSRSKALREADLVVVIGAPLDFRLGFGDFPGASVIHLESAPELIADHVDLSASIGTRLDTSLEGLVDAIVKPASSEDWLASLRATEADMRAAARAELNSAQTPIHPMRVYGELAQRLDKDAVIIGDGGDFVSYAGREVPSYAGGRWLDPGPFGALGCGPGYALGARIAHPKAQVVLLYGDGALGFSAADLETLVRHEMPVVCVVGNNGVWGLEKHPMNALYGYDVAADLRAGIRYDTMMESFGGRGELVTDPQSVGPALERAFGSDVPYLVNVLTDPSVAYPRSATLA
jgi:acetolactate synthase I/II/III large subunit